MTPERLKTAEVLQWDGLWKRTDSPPVAGSFVRYVADGVASEPFYVTMTGEIPVRGTVWAGCMPKGEMRAGTRGE